MADKLLVITPASDADWVKPTPEPVKRIATVTELPPMFYHVKDGRVIVPAPFTAAATAAGMAIVSEEADGVLLDTDASADDFRAGALLVVEGGILLAWGAASYAWSAGTGLSLIDFDTNTNAYLFRKDN